MFRLDAKHPEENMQKTYYFVEKTKSIYAGFVRTDLKYQPCTLKSLLKTL